ncbi:MAG: hypothetical protein K2X27_24985 [Candidatus Obscuribacterales bacterium]|nr:hypothetical protein [Candidatus Obscuribacterales bacterium]
MKCFIHLICDYAPGDLAWAEVYSAMTARLPENSGFHITSVGSFDTIATGFVLGQLALTDKSLRPENLVIFANCAPRKDRKEARENNAGEGLLAGVLKNGVRVLVVNSGFSMSFIREHISQLWTVDVEEEGSQFRSRDFFPRALSRMLNNEDGFKKQLVNPMDVIRDYPEEVIGYIDSFGNLKTTIRAGDHIIADLKAGDRIKVRIGTVLRTATVATGSFNVMEGDLAFAPGSSGQDRRFWEFFQRGGSASAEFGFPHVGSNIVIEHVQ